MATVLEQLKADYEASTQGEWIEAEDKSICVPYVWMVADFVPREPDRRHVIGAHNRFPLLLAMAEAAIAEWDTHRIWQEADDSLEDTDEAWDAVWQRIDAAHEAFRAAIARLLEETDA